MFYKNNNASNNEGSNNELVPSPFCKAILVVYLKEDPMDKTKIILLYQTFRIIHSTKFKEVMDGISLLWVINKNNKFNNNCYINNIIDNEHHYYYRK